MGIGTASPRSLSNGGSDDVFGLRSIRIGRILGIDIEIHASWLVIFVLVFILVSTSILPAARGAARPFAIDFIMGLIASACFFGSVLVHELAH